MNLYDYFFGTAYCPECGGTMEAHRRKCPKVMRDGHDSDPWCITGDKRGVNRGARGAENDSGARAAQPGEAIARAFKVTD